MRVLLSATLLFNAVRGDDLQLIAGYLTASDVQAHANIDLDQAAIEGCYSDYTGYDTWEECAAKWYEEGGNSVKGTGFRTIQGFSTSAEAKFDKNDFTVASTFQSYYDSWTWADDFIQDALDGTTGVWATVDIEDGAMAAVSFSATHVEEARFQAVKKGSNYMAILMYALYEYNGPPYEANEGGIAEEDQASDGLVHTWDEGWAFWAGSQEDGTGTASAPYTLGEKRDASFGTLTVSANGGTAVCNEKMLAASQAARDLLNGIAADPEATTTTTLDNANMCIQKQAFVGVIQGCIQYGYKAEACTDECGGEFGEVYTFCAAMLPLLSAVSTTDAAIVSDYANIGDSSTFLVSGFAAMRDAIYNNINAMGYTCEEIGTYNDDTGYTCTDSTTPTDYCADFTGTAVQDKAQVSETRQELAGYETVSDVQEHANIDLDQQVLEACKSESGEDKFTCAAAAYESGGFSSGGSRTIQGFSTNAEAKFDQRDFTVAATFQTYFDSWTYADDFIGAALAGTGVWADDVNVMTDSDTRIKARFQAAKKGTTYMATLMYALYEYNSANYKAADGTIDDEDTGYDGLAHAWDEGWAFFTGTLEDGTGTGKSPYTLGEKRDGDFGTNTADNPNGGTAVNNYNILIASEIGRDLLNGIANDPDDDTLAVISKSYECIEKNAFVGLIQGCLKYGYKSKNTCGTGDDDDCGDEYGEMYVFCSAMLPLLDAESSAAATTVSEYIDLGNSENFLVDTYDTFRDAIYDNLNGMGYSCADIGVYTDDTYTCTDTAAPTDPCAEMAGLAAIQEGLCTGSCVTSDDGETCTFTTKFDVHASATGYMYFEECGASNTMPTLGLRRDVTYIFDQSDISNWYHPLGFAYYPDGAHNGVDELEPSITQETTDSCQSDNACQAPMYYKDDVFLGEDGYDNSDISNIVGGEDFGLDHYEPLFFYPRADWEDQGEFSVKLTLTDGDTYDEDIFYFCHIHNKMSGRIKILDASGDAVQTANSPAIDYAYDTLSEFDEECGTFGLDEFQPGSGMCADTFLCGEGSATTLAFGECLKAMDCHMEYNMRSVLSATSSAETFMHQMIPHHQNAINMAKALLKDGEEVGEDVEEMLYTIINGQNFQINTMQAWLADNDYDEDAVCESTMSPTVTPGSDEHDDHDEHDEHNDDDEEDGGAWKAVAIVFIILFVLALVGIVVIFAKESCKKEKRVNNYPETEMNA